MLKLRRERDPGHFRFVLRPVRVQVLLYTDSADTNRWPLPVGGRMICLF